MITPSFEALESLVEKRQCFFGGSRLSGNPRLTKYYWRIFWGGSPCDGLDFFQTTPLATKEALELIEALQKQGACFCVYNFRLRRLGVSIWNMNSPVHQGKEWATVYDDDPDPISASGHR
jgi:hypothetical protein